MATPLTISPADIAIVAPELAGLDVSRASFFSDLAQGYVSASRYGSRYKTAVILMSAHLLTLASRGGSNGPVISETVGDISRSYANNGSGDGDLGSTPYGMMLLQLRKQQVVTPLLV